MFSIHFLYSVKRSTGITAEILIVFAARLKFSPFVKIYFVMRVEKYSINYPEFSKDINWNKYTFNPLRNSIFSSKCLHFAYFLSHDDIQNVHFLMRNK